MKHPLESAMFIGALATAMWASSGCDDPVQNEYCPVADERVCVGNVVMICDYHAWEVHEDCAARGLVCVTSIPQGGQCVPDTSDDGLPEIRMMTEALHDWINSISTLLATWTSGLIDITEFGATHALIDAAAAQQNASYVDANSEVQLVGSSGEGRLVAGDYVIVRARFAEAAANGSADHRLIYSVVFDSDGDPANNWQWHPPWDWDLFQGADRWYQLTWLPESATWSLTCTQVGADQTTTEVSTDARVMLDDDGITFLIPSVEIPNEFASYRVTAYGDDGSWSEDDRGADVSGADPTEPPIEIDGP